MENTIVLYEVLKKKNVDMQFHLNVQFSRLNAPSLPLLYQAHIRAYSVRQVLLAYFQLRDLINVGSFF